MKRKTRATIKDVARASGVSTQTVSRVLNDRPDVLPETRARVQKVIEELNYAPNVLARSLSRGRSNTLGIVGFGLQYFGSTSVLTGIEHQINEFGLFMLLSLLEQFVPARVDHILENFLSLQVEGVIWAVPGQGSLHEWAIAKIEDSHVPFVYLNNDQHPQHHVVSVDNLVGGRLATEHLLEQGYDRIGIITGPEHWWEAQQREQGWRHALSQAGKGEDMGALRVGGDWTAASGDIGLRKLLTQCADMDAVFVSNDQMALGALQAARRLGLRVPQDLAVVGFDDIPEAAYFHPSLTTICQDAEQLGALAVKTLYGQIQARRSNEPFEPTVSQVVPRLVVRASSGLKGA